VSDPLRKLKTQIRRLENQVYQRDRTIESQYRMCITGDQLLEAFRRCGWLASPVQCRKLAVQLEGVIHGQADETLKELRDTFDKLVCQTCEGKGCEKCDLTGIPAVDKFTGGSGVRVIRKTGGLS
jgi:hypothetical protein